MRLWLWGMVLCLVTPPICLPAGFPCARDEYAKQGAYVVLKSVSAQSLVGVMKVTTTLTVQRPTGK